MCAPDPFAQMWPRLLEKIAALPEDCGRHEPPHRVVTTLKQGVRNCVLEFGESGVTFASDRSRNKNFVPAGDFQKMWDALCQAQPRRIFLDAPNPALPVRTRILGATLLLLDCCTGGNNDISHLSRRRMGEK